MLEAASFTIAAARKQLTGGTQQLPTAFKHRRKVTLSNIQNEGNLKF